MARVAKEHPWLFQSEEAVRVGMRAFGTSKEALGPEHPDTIFAANIVSAIYKIENGYDELVGMHPQVVEILQHTAELHMPGSMQGAMSIAISYMQEQKFKEAEDLLLVNLIVYQEIHGLHHSDSLECMGERTHIPCNPDGRKKMLTDITKTCNHDHVLYPASTLA